MLLHHQPAFRAGVVSIFALGLSLLSGCGMGTSSTGLAADGSGSGAPLAGMLHGGPNPIVGATITLYTTTSNGYGATANVVTSTTSGSDGSFSLPTATNACPSGEYAYVTAYGGTTGAKTNSTSLLMVPIGLCSSNYSFSGGVNTYTGPYLWINEVTTAVSAYALGNFMTVTNAGVVNIGSPATNHSTASASSASPSAAGLAHAFANALAIVNISTGLPKTYTNGGTSATTGGLIPGAELLLLGNILQGCVNTNGPTGTNTATSNDGTVCGKLYSLTTPPQGVASPLPVPTNTMQAMLDLARYPSPLLNTWDTTCTTAGSGTKSATSCLFGLAAGISSGYVGALSAAPPDWTLVVTYGSAYGAQTGNAGCTGTCPGLVYPFNVALDYQDNVYVLNQDALSASVQNIVALSPTGNPLWASPNDATYFKIQVLSTDTAGHVLGTNSAASPANYLRSFNTLDGSLFASVSTGTSTPTANAVDSNNNVYYQSTAPTTNLRRFTYDGSNLTTPYTAQTFSTVAASSVGGPLQIVLDSNLNVFGQEPSSGGNYKVDYALNVGSVSAPAYNSYSTVTVAGSVVGGTTSNGAYGITMDAAGNAYAGAATGFTKITRTVTGSGSTAAASLAAGSTVLGTPLNGGTADYFHYLYTDGSGNILSADNDNGGGPAGIQVLDVADVGTGTPLSLGGYKGCVVSGTACGTSTTTPAFSPRGMAIDSAGDVYIVSGSNKTLAEYIGVAAPTWPGLSMLKTGKP
jgi:hypothetical protein